jgi:mannose-1-phosphate guanylyltransferase
MKAFLLAAGIGSRLRPLTDVTPKCMVDIDGRPLLDIWLAALAAAGIGEVHVNLHHRPEVVWQYLAGRSEPPLVSTSFEPSLLGSAGTLVANREWIADEDVFLACNADNLTDFDVSTLVAAHRSGGAPATVTVFRSDDPGAGGVVELDETARVVGFVEKPRNPRSDLVNAGMYAFAPAVVDEIDGEPPRDIGYHLLPRLVGRARAVQIDGYFRDIGTPAAYRLARSEWSGRVRQ